VASHTTQHVAFVSFVGLRVAFTDRSRPLTYVTQPHHGLTWWPDHDAPGLQSRPSAGVPSRVNFARPVVFLVDFVKSRRNLFVTK
jgi:hypothetical protein